MIEKNLDILSDTETAFIDLIGDIFDLQGFPRRFGKIFSLLMLRSDSRGLSQTEISNYLDIHVTTVWRTMKRMEALGYFTHIKKTTKSKKTEFYYIIDKSIRELSIHRLEAYLHNLINIKSSLSDFKEKKVKSHETKLLNSIDQMLAEYSVIFNEYNVLLSNLKEKNNF